MRLLVQLATLHFFARFTTSCSYGQDCPTTLYCESSGGKSNTCQSCSSNSDCISNSCSAGTCAKQTCSDRSGCPSNFCRNSQCEFCNGGDCGSGYTCDNGYCLKQSCSSDSQCFPTYSCQSRSCDFCSKNSDCSTAYYCSNKLCVALPTCTQNSQCFTNYCNTSGSICNFCSSSSNCDSNYQCKNGYCLLKTCSLNSDCTITNYCTSNNQCDFCNNDNDCPQNKCDNGICLKVCGTETLGVSTTLANQNYVVGDAFAQQSYSFTYSYTGSGTSTQCNYGVTSTESPTTRSVSLQKSNSTVNWYTNNCTNNLGTFTVTVKGVVSDDSSISATTSFVLTVTGPATCACTTEILSITETTAPTAQTYYVTAAQGSQTISEFTVSPTICSTSDIYYTMSVTNSGTNFISFDTVSRTVSWKTSTSSRANTYTITITATINTATIQTGSTSFVLTVIASCAYDTSSFTIVPSAATNQNYNVGTASVFYSIGRFILKNAAVCQQSDIIYTISVSPNTTFITFSPSVTTTTTTSYNIISWFTNSDTDVGSYTITIIGTVNAASIIADSVSFTLQVVITCQYSSESIDITPSSVTDQTYTIGSSTASIQFDSFRVDSSICKQSDIVYTMTVTPTTSGQSTSFITQTPSSRTVSWLSNSNSDAGVFTITLIGTVTDKIGTFTDQAQFTLTVSASCSGDSTLFTVTETTTLTALSYLVGSTQGSQLISQFNLTSSVCTQSNIVYTMTVLPSNGTSFISFDSSTMIVKWQTNSNSDANSYNITIIGTVNAQTVHTGTTSFKLTVAAGCQSSSESPITITPSTVSNQNYKIGNTGGSYTVPKFSLDSQYCTQSDISYTMTVEPATSGQATSFITLDQSNLLTSWVSSSSADVGVFTIRIVGLVQALTSFTASTSYTLNVQTCSSSTESITISSTQTNQTSWNYTVYDQAGILQISNFNLNSIFCAQNEIAYSMTVSPSLSTIVFLNLKSPMEVQWSSSSNSDAGLYSVIIQGTLTNAQSTYKAYLQFYVTILALQCVNYTGLITISQPSILPLPQNYTVNDTSGSQLINQFSQNSLFCTQSDITYSMTVQPSKSGQDPSFITFNGYTRIVSWKTSDNTLSGNYTIKITGSLDSNSNFVSFILTVNSLNVAPILQALGTNTVMTYQVNQLTSNVLSLGPIYDSDSADVVKSSMRGVPDASLFVFNNVTGQLSFDLNGLLQQGGANGFTYTIIILLQDSNKVHPGNTTYVLNFVISPAFLDSSIGLSNSTNKTTNNKTQKQNFTYQVQQQQDTSTKKAVYSIPYWKSMTTDNDGFVQISFSEDFVIPANFSNMDSQVLDVSLIKATSVDKKYLKFTWNVTQYTNKYFGIQLYFENPLHVSSQGKNNLDQIRVSSLDNTFFLAKKSLLSIDPASSLIKKLSPQLSSNKAANAALAKVTNTMESGGQTIMIGSAIGNILMSASLQQLWGMINSLQIIGQLPNFNINMPANAASFFNFVTNLSNFNLFPTAQIYEWLGLGFLVKKSQSSNQSNQVQPIQNSSNQTNTTKRSLLSQQNQNSSTGYSSENTQTIFVQLGPIFLVLIIGIVLLLVLMILKFLRRFQPIKIIINEIYLNLQRKIFWNATLTYIMESYLQLTQKSLSQFHDGLDWFDWASGFSSLFSIITLTICIVAPITMTIYFKINFRKFRFKAFNSRFGSVTNNLNWRVSQSSTFISIFCYRRLVEVLIIQYLDDYSCAQVQLMIMCSVTVIIMFGTSLSMNEARDRRLEYFNEATIMCCVQHCVIFTPFYAEEPTAVYTMGYSMIVFAVLNIFVNASVLLYVTFFTTLRKYKIVRQKYRKWKRARNLKKAIKKRQFLIEQGKFLRNQKYFKEMIRKLQEEQPSGKQVEAIQKVLKESDKHQQRETLIRKRQEQRQMKNKLDQQKWQLKEIIELPSEMENDLPQVGKPAKQQVLQTEPQPNSFTHFNYPATDYKLQSDWKYQNQNGITVLKTKTNWDLMGNSLNKTQKFISKVQEKDISPTTDRIEDRELNSIRKLHQRWRQEETKQQKVDYFYNPNQQALDEIDQIMQQQFETPQRLLD